VANLQQFLEHGIYIVLILVLVLCGVGLPIPEEVVFLAAGYAASEVHANVWLVCAAGVIGILMGDSIPFLMGKHYGMSLLKWRLFSRVLTEKRLTKTRTFFDAHGSKTVFFARFVAGLRVPTFFISATMGVRYRVFLFWNGLGALISCPISIWLAYCFGRKAEHLLKESKPVVVAVLAAAIVLFFAIHIYRSKKKASDQSAIDVEDCEASLGSDQASPSVPSQLPDEYHEHDERNKAAATSKVNKR